MASDKLLVSTDYAAPKLGISETLLDAVEDALSDALRSAQLRISSELDSKLQVGSATDTFYLDSTSFSGIQPGGFYRCYLTSGLLSAAPLVYSGKDATGDIIPATDYRVDVAKGIVHIDSSLYEDEYVTVVSSFGFSAASEVPNWLKDAITSYAPAMFSGHASEGSNDAKQDYKVLVDHALALCAPYRRNRGFCLLPLFS